MHHNARHRWLPHATFLLFVLSLLSGSAWASGGYSGGGYSGGSLSSSRSDPTYDVGKSIYQGRSKGHRGLRICLVGPETNDGNSEVVALSRKSLRPLKGRHWRDLTTGLVNCEAPSSKVSTILGSTEMQALVYYLNKRFRLRLEG